MNRELSISHRLVKANLGTPVHKAIAFSVLASYNKSMVAKKKTYKANKKGEILGVIDSLIITGVNKITVYEVT